MFKVESYISPYLLSYLGKYVKLKQEDFRVSLWGGDAVFHNLELQYEILESLLPFKTLGFKSGQVHELRVHIPWTKLGSESVLFTLNTVECIMSLKAENRGKSETESCENSSTQNNTQQQIKQSYVPTDEEMPPGYLQSFLNRIINNLHVVVNNFILKFVEDDMVISMNVKSLEIFSANKDWSKAFVEVLQSELTLRRVLTVTDMTVCLDKTNLDGHIATFEEPLLYRCSLSCRMETCYNNFYWMSPVKLKMQFLLTQFNLSVTDTQLPMLARLLELAFAMYYGTLDPARIQPCRTPSDTATPQDSPDRTVAVDGTAADYANDQQSWSSWAWSYVPQIVPQFYDDEDFESPDDASSKSKENPALLFNFGVFVEKCTIEFKLTNKSCPSTALRRGHTRRMEACPVLFCSIEGIAFQVHVYGVTFFSAQIGLSRIQFHRINCCTCGDKEEETAIGETTCLINLGYQLPSSSTVNYLSGSLFDECSASSKDEEFESNCWDDCASNLSKETYLSMFTEALIWKKFPAMWIDYLYTLELVKEGLTLKNIDVLQLHDQDGIREKSLKRVFFGRSEINVCASLLHRCQTLFDCLNSEKYEPYSKKDPEVIDFQRAHPAEDQIARLHEYIPTRTFFILVMKPTLKIYPLDHNLLDRQEQLPYLQCQCERLEYQVDLPMYSRHLIRRVSRLLNPGEVFLSHCYENSRVKVAGCCATLILPKSSAKSVIACPIMSPTEFEASRKTLLLPAYWISNHLTHDEITLDLPSLNMIFSQSQLALCVLISLTWLSDGCYRLNKGILLSLIRTASNYVYEDSPPQMDVTVSGLSSRYTRTYSCSAFLISLCGALQGSLLHIHSGKVMPFIDSSVRTPSTSTLSGDSNSDANQPTSAANKSKPLPGKAANQKATEDLSVLKIACQIPNDFDTLNVPFLCHVYVAGLCGLISHDLITWFDFTHLETVILSPLTPEFAPSSFYPPSMRDVSMRRSNLDSLSQRDSGSETISQYKSDKLTIVKLAKSRLQKSIKSAKSSTKESRTTMSTSKISISANTSVWKTLKQWFLVNFIKLQRLDLQILIKPCSLFLMQKSPAWSDLDEPSSIFKLIQTVHSEQTQSSRNIFEVILPEISLLNHAVKTFTLATSLPIKHTINASTTADMLPWRLSATNLTCHWYGGPSHSDSQVVLRPVTLNCTIAASAKFSSPAVLAQLDSLAWCLHADINQALSIEVTQEQLAKAFQLSFVYSTGILNAAFRLQDFATSAVSYVPKDNQAHHKIIQISHGEALLTSQKRSRKRESMLANDQSFKLSLWSQVTLVKCHAQVTLLDDNSKQLCFSLSELTISMDVQEQYSQIKGKLGAMSCKKYMRRPDGTVTTITILGPERYHIRPVQHMTSNPQKSAHNSPSVSGQLFSSPEMSSSTVNSTQQHFSANLVLTRALTSDIRQRCHHMQDEDMEESDDVIKPLLHTKHQSCLDLGSNDTQQSDSAAAIPPSSSSQTGSISVGPTQEAPLFSTSEYLNEISLTLEPLDIVLNYDLVQELSEFINSLSLQDLVQFISRNQSKSQHRLTSSQPKESSKPWFISSEWPLLYLDLKAVRLFSPVPMPKNRNSQYDTLIVSWASLTMRPFSSNPLQRLVIDQELYALAHEMKALRLLGSTVEDRQYHISWQEFSVCAGEWKCLLQPSSETSMPGAGPLDSSDPSTAIKVPTPPVMPQNPAFEWNKCTNDWADTTTVVKPLLTKLNLDLILVPAIYSGPADKLKDKVICGYSLEVNITSQMNWYLSQTDFDLIHRTVEYVQTQSEAIKQVSSSFKPKDSGYISTYTALPKPDLKTDFHPESQQPTAPKSTLHSLNNLIGFRVTPMNLLLTGGKFSLTYYEIVERTSNEETRCRVLLNGEISQPHLILVTDFSNNNDKLELSCYDIQIRVLPDGHPQALVHEDILFLDDGLSLTPLCRLFESMPGAPDAKTGILPALLTVSLYNFFNSPGRLELNIERSLCLEVSPSNVKTLQRILNLISFSQNYSNEKLLTEKTVNEGRDNIFSLLANSVGVSTEELNLILKSDQQSIFDLSLAGLIFNLQMIHLNEVESQVLKFDVNMAGASLATQYSRSNGRPCRRRILLNPAWMSISAQINQYVVENSTSTQCDTTVDIDLIDLSMGQENLLAIKQILEEFTNHFCKSNVKTNHLHSRNENCEMQQHQIFEFKDELRATNTKFHIVSSGSTNPLQFRLYSKDKQKASLQPPILKAHEIIVLNSSECNDGEGVSGLCWCYPQPRCISRLHVIPVPFAFVELQATGDSGNLHHAWQLPCQLQFWDNASMSFVTYTTFCLSENDPQEVVLPDVNLSEFSLAIRVSNLWRVVIDCFARSQLRKDEVSLVHISPLTLAACMRVDSVYLPDYLPTISLSGNISNVQVAIVDQKQVYGSKILGHELEPFIMNQALFREDSQCLCVHLHRCNSKIVTHLKNSRPNRLELNLDFSLAVDLTNHESAIMENFISPITLKIAHSGVLTEQNCWKRKIQLSCENDLRFNFTQGNVHSLQHLLSISSHIFGGDLSEQKSMTTTTRYIFCNNTTQVFYLQQFNTSDNSQICLQPRTCIPWTWSLPSSNSSNPNCSILVGLLCQSEHLIIRWGPSISLSSISAFSFKEKDCKFTPQVIQWNAVDNLPAMELIVTVQKLTNTLTKIIFHGNLIFRNALSLDLELQITQISQPSQTDLTMSNSGQTSSELHPLRSNCCTPGIPLLIGADHIVTNISVRAVSTGELQSISSLPWCESVALRIPQRSGDGVQQEESNDKFIQRLMIKILLTSSEYLDATAMIHSVCTIEQIPIESSTWLTVITFSPMIIVENIMPFNLHLTMHYNSSSLNESIEIDSKGYRERGIKLNREPGFVLGAKSNNGSQIIAPITFTKQMILSSLQSLDQNKTGVSKLWFEDASLYQFDFRKLSIKRNKLGKLSGMSSWPYISNETTDYSLRPDELLSRADDSNNLICKYSLLVSITPWVIVMNLTDLDLFFKQDEEIFSLANNEFFVPPVKNEAAVNIGAMIENATRWSHSFLIRPKFTNPFSPHRKSFQEDSPDANMDDNEDKYDDIKVSLDSGPLRLCLCGPSYVTYLTLKLCRNRGVTCLLIQSSFKVINKTGKKLLLKPMFVADDERPTSLTLAECDIVATEATPISKIIDLCLWSSTSPVVKETHPTDTIVSHNHPSGCLYLLFLLDRIGLQWSLPLLVHFNQNDQGNSDNQHGGYSAEFLRRKSTSLPYYGSEDRLLHLFISVSIVLHNGIHYIEITEDKEPDFLLVNYSSWDLFFGQATSLDSAQLLGEQEEDEAGCSSVLDLPLLKKEGGIMGYNPPSRERNFPNELDTKKDWWRLRFGRLCRLKKNSEDIGVAKENENAAVSLEWSQEVDLYSESQDIFVRIGNRSKTVDDCLLWVQTRPAFTSSMFRNYAGGQTVLVIIHSDEKSRVLANEIRERLATATSNSGHHPYDDYEVGDNSANTNFDQEDSSHGKQITWNPPDYFSSDHMAPNDTIEMDCVIARCSISIMNKLSLLEYEEFIRLTFINCKFNLKCGENYPIDSVSDSSFTLGDKSHNSSANNSSSNLLPGELAVTVSCHYFQIDNQSYNRKDSIYYYPVILKSSIPSDQASLLLCLKLTGMSTMFVRDLDLSIAPLEAYIEDKFVYDLLNLLDYYTVSQWPLIGVSKDAGITVVSINDFLLPDQVLLQFRSHKAIKLCHLRIHPSELSLSFQAAIKLYVSFDRTPLSFRNYEKQRLFTTLYKLTHTLSMHYVTGALFRAGWVVGSLELLGNPSGLVRHLATGISDLVTLPWLGLSQGSPIGVAGGFGRGVGSLMRHTAGGLLGCLTSWSSSVARNLDYLSLDSAHFLRQESYRHNAPTGLTQGILQGLSGFGLSLLGAIAGIADQPIQAFQLQGVSTSRSYQMMAVASGLGRGVVGMFTKPLAGAAEFLAQTGHGVMAGTGISILPRHLDHSVVLNTGPLGSLSGTYSAARILICLEDHLNAAPGSGDFAPKLWSVDQQLNYFLARVKILTFKSSPDPETNAVKTKSKMSNESSYVLLTPCSFIQWTPGEQAISRSILSVKIESYPAAFEFDIQEASILVVKSDRSCYQQPLDTKQSRIAEYITGLHNQESQDECSTQIDLHKISTLMSKMRGSSTSGMTVTSTNSGSSRSTDSSHTRSCSLEKASFSDSSSSSSRDDIDPMRDWERVKLENPKNKKSSGSKMMFAISEDDSQHFSRVFHLWKKNAMTYQSQMKYLIDNALSE